MGLRFGKNAFSERGKPLNVLLGIISFLLFIISSLTFFLLFSFDDSYFSLYLCSLQVELAEGQSVSTISITVRDDDIAELQEVTYIQLTEIVETGTSLPGRGAQIGWYIYMYTACRRFRVRFVLALVSFLCYCILQCHLLSIKFS